jgi:hypothetical protein
VPTMPVRRLHLLILAALVGVGAWASSTVAAPAPAIDGTISDGEYISQYLARSIGMELHWTIEGDSIYIGLRAPTRGWLAIGWGPSGPIMQGEDILIGYIRGKELFLQDYFANTSVTHANDVSLGGRDDVLESSGSEDQQSTTIEFRRRLETRDRFDRPITRASHTVQLAYGPNDDFVTYHGEKRIVVKINFFEGSAQEAGLFAQPRSVGAGGNPFVPWLRTVAAGVAAIVSLTLAHLLWPTGERARDRG